MIIFPNAFEVCPIFLCIVFHLSMVFVYFTLLASHSLMPYTLECLFEVHESDEDFLTVFCAFQLSVLGFASSLISNG